MNCIFILLSDQLPLRILLQSNSIWSDMVTSRYTCVQLIHYLLGAQVSNTPLQSGVQAKKHTLHPLIARTLETI